ncbi:hypothetical protein ACIHEJ_35390 [Streptomyces sp. NPDC052301]|uniref:hypothetical protein n=1 Tax=Streptomyces sp. NPDC052301 TaxID=3365687 RepID=UPI0037D090B9
MNTKTSRRTKILIMAMVITTSVILAFIAGLLGHACHRDPADWGAWTFATLSLLGITCCGIIWATES